MRGNVMFKIRDQLGFSLLELMIVVTLLGILLSGIHNTFQAQEHAYSMQDQAAEMNQISRVAIDIMTRHIRSAACDPTGLADARIQTATAQSFVYTKDENGDGSINSDGELLGFRYDADNTEIEQCYGSTSCTWYRLVDNIQNLQFRYIYEDGNSSDFGDTGMPDNGDEDDTNDLEDIREVEIQIVARRNEGYGKFLPSKVLTSRVVVRNLAIR
jgi:prepilin-type N-terminal cleavage/methylation domain-containing protein